MIKSDIKKTITALAKLMGTNSELMTQQINSFKALVPGIDETALVGIIEKSKNPNFNLSEMDEEIGKIVEAVKTSRKK